MMLISFSNFFFCKTILNRDLHILLKVVSQRLMKCIILNSGCDLDLIDKIVLHCLRLLRPFTTAANSTMQCNFIDVNLETVTSQLSIVFTSMPAETGNHVVGRVQNPIR